MKPTVSTAATAGGLAYSCVVVLAWALKRWAGTDLPPDVFAALVVILGTLGHQGAVVFFRDKAPGVSTTVAVGGAGPSLGSATLGSIPPGGAGGPAGTTAPQLNS